MDKFEERDWVVLENEGQKIFGVIHKPIGINKCPAVLFCHGFAGNKCGKNRMYVTLANQLCEAGIAVLRMDFRGCGDSEGDVTDMTLETELSDALLGFKYLQNQPFIDSSRIGIFGRSLGGALAVIAANRYGKTKSIVLWAPVFHSNQWKEHWKRAQTKITKHVPLDHAMHFNGQVAGKAFVKSLFEMDLIKEISALDHIPLLHIHGEKDAMVKIDHAECYVHHRKDSKGESKFVRLTHSDHDFNYIDEQKIAMIETTEWFKKTL